MVRIPFFSRSDDAMTGLVLDVSEVCQLRCPLCILRSFSERPRPPVMPLAVTEAVIPYLKGLESIDLTGWGEPLMNPKLDDLAALIRKNFEGKLTMTTNGLLFDARTMAMVVDLEFDTVCISTDAASGETYSRYRAGGDFQALRRVFDGLVKARGGASRPLLFANYLLRAGSLSELPEFVRLVAGHGFNGVVFQMLTGVFSEEGLSEITHSAYYHNAFDSAALEAAVGEAKKAAPGGFVIAGPELICSKPAGACGGFDISRPYIAPSGEVSACCAMAYPVVFRSRAGEYVKTPSLSFGNVLTTPLPKIWRGKAYAKIRGQVNRGGTPPACANCMGLFMKKVEPWVAP